MSINEKKIKVLLTGSTGFIGKNLLERLVTDGYDVYAVIHNNDYLTYHKNKVNYDGTYNSLKNSLVDQKIDVVIHLATMFLSNHKPELISDLIDSNIKFGNYILELTKELEIKFFISTSTYAQSFSHDGYNPQNLYAATKQAYEAIQRYYEETTQTRFLTLELTDTYGPGDNRPKFINLVLDAIQKGIILNMSKGEQEINYLYIDDVVQGYVKAINLLLKGKIPENIKYSLFSNEKHDLKNLVKEICRITNSNLETNPGYFPYRDREIMKFKPSYEKLPDWDAQYTLGMGITKLQNYKNEN